MNTVRALEKKNRFGVVHGQIPILAGRWAPVNTESETEVAGALLRDSRRRKEEGPEREMCTYVCMCSAVGKSRVSQVSSEVSTAVL